jgi:hypothetical protein
MWISGFHYRRTSSGIATERLSSSSKASLVTKLSDLYRKGATIALQVSLARSPAQSMLRKIPLSRHDLKAILPWP